MVATTSWEHRCENVNKEVKYSKGIGAVEKEPKSLRIVAQCMRFNLTMTEHHHQC